MRSFRPVLLLAIVAVLVGGCSSAQERTYELDVFNERDRPATLWLLKDGRPFEETWRSPEDYAWFQDGEHGGVVVGPGEVAQASRRGMFAPEARAVLIVYDGDLTFNEMLATPQGSSLRQDLVVRPGKTRIRLTERGTEQEQLGGPAE